MNNNILVCSLVLVSSTIFAESGASFYSESLDSIADEIFQEIEPTSNYFPSESDYKALSGLQYLYCSISADILLEKEKSKYFYAKGMAFLDDYAKEHAISNDKKYETLESSTAITDRLGVFRQPWYIDNKDILKGMMFEYLDNRVNQNYIDIGKGHKESKESVINNYKKYCHSL